MSASPTEPRTSPFRASWPDRLSTRVALGFVLISCLAFSWGWWQRSKRTDDRPCQATAVLYHQLPPEWSSLMPSPTSSGPSAAQDANDALPKPLVEAVRDLALSSRAIESTCPASQGVDMKVDRIAGPDGLRVAICCEDTSPERAALTADALAQCYAEQLRTRWQEQMQRRCDAAQAAAAEARDELLKAQTRLDVFLQVQAAAQARGAPPLDTPTTPQPGAAAELGLETPAHDALPQHAAAPLPHIKRGRPHGESPGARRIENPHGGMVENPRRAELSEQIEQLRTRLAELLETRTPLHPLVQQVEQDLQAAEARLAEEPQWLPDEQPGDSASAGRSGSAATRVPNPYVSADSASPPPTPPAPVPADTPGGEDDATGPRASGASAPTLAELRAELEQSSAAFDQATRREREAWEAASRQPRIEREPARATVLPGPVPVWRLALAAMLAGLLGAGGVGLISAGARIQPVLLTAAEAEAAVGAPLAGRIPAKALGLEPNAHEAPAQPEWARPVLMLTGWGLLAVCLAGAWVWVG